MRIGFKKSCKAKDILQHQGFPKKRGQTTLTLTAKEFSCSLGPQTTTSASARAPGSTTVPVPRTRPKGCLCSHAGYVRSCKGFCWSSYHAQKTMLSHLPPGLPKPATGVPEVFLPPVQITLSVQTPVMAVSP